MKKQHWKVGCICTALCIFTAAIPAMPAFADDETATESTTEAATTEEALGSGTCGENLTWRLVPEKNSQGLTEYTLYIDGTGDMEDYDAYDQSTTIDYRFVEMETTPWKNLDETIHKIIIADGVTSIGNFAFCGAILGGSDGIIVELPDSITRIGDYAFMNAGKGWGSRSTLKLSKFPKNLKTIGEGAFLSVTFEDSHLVLPDGLESIGAVAFSDEYSAKDYDGTDITTSEPLLSVTIPKNVTDIGEKAFGASVSATLLANGEEITGSSDLKTNAYCSMFRTVWDTASYYTNSDDFTVYGYTGSTAETYATENDFTFVALDEITGDLNVNGQIDLLDAILLNKYLAKIVTFSDQQLKNADCYADGQINDEDTKALMRYLIFLIDTLPEE